MKSGTGIDTEEKPADEIGLIDLVRVLWSSKWILAGSTVAAAVASVLVALALPNIYRAEATLAPNQGGGAAGLSSLASQYGGLASLAGIDLGSGSVDNTEVGLKILQSGAFLAEFIERHEILVPVMAAENWDQSTDKLAYDEKIYNSSTATWVRKVSPPRGAVPSFQEAYGRFYDEFFTVSP